ncbi:hypothetical protein H6P81_002245 [Aristolochia fimbriata]|uniref:Uncharacterized protein n=1 Tax=Aristolochia fimbriata TaxID=158543 RepID=A0AAV7FCG7_ARIFI|nr:hypothetical protein H6P81_002245 [Aristolochia fimbriata]
MDPLILDGEMFHLSCYINLLNSIAHDLLEVVKDATEKVHNNIFFWSSTGRVEKFEEAARKLQIPSSEKLILDDYETEWILSDWVSTYHMLRCAMKYKDVLSHLIQQEEASWALPSLPSYEEWKMAEEACDKLEIFHETAILFSRSKCPTPNLLFPYCCKIMLKLKEWVKSDNEVIPGLANGMLAKFECYWRSCSFPLSLAVVLDPRTARSKDADFPELEMFLCLGQSNNNLTDELDYYLEQPLVPRDPGFDVLEWWNTQAIRYPTLMLIARDVLSIPISTDSSKSAFMMGERLLKPHHSELLPETLEALMCTRDWLAAEVLFLQILVLIDIPYGHILMRGLTKAFTTCFNRFI